MSSAGSIPGASPTDSATETVADSAATSSITTAASTLPEPDSADTAAAAVSNCQVCGLHASKYKCPGCMTRTCSLGCSKKHKAQTKCSGTRDRTKFIKRSEYDDNTLMSDYGFLQDMARDHANMLREANSRSIGMSGKSGINNRNPLPAQSNFNSGSTVVLNRSQKNIASRAKAQRQVQIRYMSPGIQRSKLNKTIWASTWSRLVWTLEIVVPELEPQPAKWVETGFHDVCKVADLWNRLLAFSPTSSASADAGADEKRKRARTEGVIKIQLPSDDSQEHQFRSAISHEMLQQLKQRFGSKSANELIWLVRVQDMPANRPTFCKIDAGQPLYTQLRYQTVLEFPTVYVYSQMPSTWNGHEISIREACTGDENGDSETKEAAEAVEAAEQTTAISTEETLKPDVEHCESDQMTKDPLIN
ncbi:Box C/D snoRNA accumulation [Coemansia sp. RSA 1722]|nr:Box C/D snoRNA accumulation [Coemansia sp. RSA 486]KAJ2591270.1 Box C/D snoRNA accumulation [Coemansia sp. RSA 1722]